MNDTDTLISRIRAIVAEVLVMSPDEIDDNEHFVHCYQADSLNLMEVVAKVEKEYRVVLPQSELQQSSTVSALSRLVIQQIA
ncbi:acyl carrier protein [Mycobacteroides abscessus]|uniref:acyl carrier protein n=1 Tax=Mycobacteroides abscessus TaxID=36809 RepID=UPI000C26A09A|nr:acyl carrier protein [Mycobacteroides abscessus]